MFVSIREGRGGKSKTRNVGLSRSSVCGADERVVDGRQRPLAFARGAVRMEHSSRLFVHQRECSALKQSVSGVLHPSFE